MFIISIYSNVYNFYYLLLFICYFAHNPFLNLRMFNVFLDTHISVICVFTLFYRLLINII